MEQKRKRMLDFIMPANFPSVKAAVKIVSEGEGEMPFINGPKNMV